jgi:transketolase
MSISHNQLANAIRSLSMDAVEKAKSGHPGMPMGMADVATVLFGKFLRFDPKNPKWADRDRFILSAGHGSMLLYSILYLTGYEDMTIEQIKNFRQLHSKTCGHPELGEAGGIETTTGPLGQGIANSVGFAIAEKALASRYGNDIVDHYTYVIAGDGCLMEGISHEAAGLAGHLKLNKLIVLFDDNKITIDGATSLSTSDDNLKRFEAYGWAVDSIDGHNPTEIEAAIKKAKTSDKPTLIACRTTIAKGAPTKAGTSASHGSPLGEKELAGAKAALGIDYPAFEIPSDILTAWREIGTNSAKNHAEWQKKYSAKDAATRAEFERVMSGKLSDRLTAQVAEVKKKFSESEPMATRKSSGLSIEGLFPAVPEFMGGSADLSESNLTKFHSQKTINSSDFSGSYIYYGIREHGMAAAMNGIVLHGGFIPYGGTFMVFTDYCRPSIRLSALMKQRVIYVMTHDSIGLGEDGPTHQPVEHVSALRAIPNLYVFRPADATETLESWEASLRLDNAPSVLSLTRQNVPNLRKTYVAENLVSKGGYILSEAEGGKPDVIIIGTGSEVTNAMEAQTKLKERGIKARIVSMPCQELFDEQSPEYKKSVIGENTVLRAVIEAGIQQSWDKYLGFDGIFVGMNSFGASAPAPELYKYFGITTDDLVKKVVERLGR